MQATTAPERGPCVVCGEPVGAEPHWVVDGGAGVVHHRCRDWSRVPFPFGEQLRTLRRLLKEARGVARDTVAVGLALRAIQRRWPAGGREAYDEGRRKIHALRERVNHLAAIARRLW